MLIPEVVGFRLTNRLPEGATATDLVLTITERLRKVGVVGKFVEFYGPGPRVPDDRRSRDARQHVAGVRRDDRDLPDRRDDARLPAADGPRRIAGAAGRGVREGAGTVPHRRLRPIRSTRRRWSSICRPSSRASPGPKRPQDRVSLNQAKLKFQQALEVMLAERKSEADAGVEAGRNDHAVRDPAASGRDGRGGGGARRPSVAPGMEGLDHGAVVVAAITSCTNTSNPSVMIGAGLLARNAVQRGLKIEAVGEDEPRAGLAGRHRVPARGRACSSRSPSSASISSATAARRASATAARCPSRCRRSSRTRTSSWRRCSRATATSRDASSRRCARTTSRRRRWSSPTRSPARCRSISRASRSARIATAQPVHLRDIWPTEREIQETMLKAVRQEMFREKYAHVFDGDERWRYAAGSAGRALQLGAGFHLHPQSAVLRGGDARADAADRHSAARACSRCSATA